MRFNSKSKLRFITTTYSSEESFTTENEFQLTWWKERRGYTIPVLCDDTLPFVWVWYKVRLNGTIFKLFLENKAEFQKSGKLKQLKLSYSLSLCLFEALKIRHL